MKIKYLKIIVCPKCKTKPILLSGPYRKKEILFGKLQCQKCKNIYQITNGLSVMLKKDAVVSRTQKAFEKEWSLYYKGHFGIKDLYGKSEKEELTDFERLLQINKKNVRRKRILDAGCGSGRLTGNVARKFKDAEVFGVDIGRSIVLAHEKYKLSNLELIQADINFLPFPEYFFDYVWSEGVIHHTKNPEKSFKELSRVLKKGGRIYIWVYPKYVLTPYLVYRKLFPKSYLLTTKRLYLLYYLLSIPTYIIYRLANILNLFTNSYKLKSLTFKIFDTLAPEHQYYFSKKEILNWFRRQNYKDIEIVGDIGITAVKS